MQSSYEKADYCCAEPADAAAADRAISGNTKKGAECTASASGPNLRNQMKVKAKAFRQQESGI